MPAAGPVRVLVDAWHLSESRHRGIGRYLNEVLRRLADDASLEVAALTLEPRDVPSGIEPRRIRRFAPDRLHRREQELMLSIDLARHRGWKPDVVWCPGPEAPRRSTVPVVSMLHDVTAIIFDDPALTMERRQLWRMAPRYRRSAAFVANSAYTADSTARVLGLDRSRIAVAHLGVDPVFQPADVDRRGDPYVLVVGVYGPHKGYAEACAVSDALATAGHRHRLKIVGEVGPWNEPTIRALVNAARAPDRIEIAGFVDDLVSVYQGASALIMTSRHEGFGLPLVEAMACGTPVVGFANSSVPEVIGDGGDVVADGDTAAMAGVVSRLLGDAAAWRAASQRALARARVFDWAETARVHADVFRAVARG